MALQIVLVFQLRIESFLEKIRAYKNIAIHWPSYGLENEVSFPVSNRLH